ncbi:hypothetical protein FACS1894211_01180 [Clostridia bacterium]|nr:hypothetical protein FACS1894211_01180 [Clostridia bacterium]
MKKKGILFLLAAALCLPPFGFATSVRAAAPEIDPGSPTPSFYDDFEGYTAFGESGYAPKQLNAKWDNEFIDLDESDSNDVECADDKYAVRNDGGNKVLEINNTAANGSFFYIAPKEIRTKDFELSMRVKPLAAEGAWFGFSMRKSVNVRYNGCDNVMIYFRIEDRAGGGTSVRFQVMRGVGGSSMDDTARIKNPASDPALHPDAVPGDNESGKSYIYDPSVSSSVPVLNEWHTVKVAADGYYFRVYFDDLYMGYYYNDKNSANQYGYASINACVAHLYADDVYLKNNDVETAPPLPDIGDGEQKPGAEVPPGTPDTGGCAKAAAGLSVCLAAALLLFGFKKK